MRSIPTRVVQPHYPSISPFDAETQVKQILVDHCKGICNTPDDVAAEVRKLMFNDLFIISGYYRNGDERVVPAHLHGIFRNRDEFLINNTCNELGIYPPIFTKPFTLKREPDPSHIADFLTAVYLLFPNQNVVYLSQNLENIKNAINTFWDRLNHTKDSNAQSMLYLYSPEGRTGKSLFIKMLERWANTRGVTFQNSRVPTNQFVGDEYYKNAIVALNEVKPEETKNWCKMNDQIDGLSYILEKKGKDIISVPTQAFLVAASNRIPKDDNNRRVEDSLFYIGDSPINDLKEVKLFKLNSTQTAVDLDYYTPVIDTLLTYCPTRDFNFTSYIPPHSTISPFVDAMSEDYLWVLRSICKLITNTNLNLQAKNNKVNVGFLVSKLNQSKERIDIDTSIRFTHAQVYHTLKNLCDKHLLVKPKNTKGTYYSDYDLTPILNNIEDILSENGSSYEYDTYSHCGIESYHKTKDCYYTMIANIAEDPGCSDWVSSIWKLK